jgi:EAL domain-containing protein (putative c-di-GMP-specific phosphodiesterase class I)/AmiR/NasT family two-component response regulator
MTQKSPGRRSGDGVQLLDDRILVVDDNRANLALMGALLEGAGYQSVLLEQDPTRVVELLGSFQPDLILLDLHMPGMDGLDILRAMSDVVAPEDFLPVIVVTADSTTETRRLVLGAGAKDLLIKPVDVIEVVQRTANLLQTRHLNRQLRLSNRSLNERLRRQEAHEREARDKHERLRNRIQDVLRGRRLTSVFQPIVDAAEGTIVGVEALTRFAAEPVRSPDQWFADAAAVGLGYELEMAAIRSALDRQAALPAGAYLSVNCSPDVLLDPGLVALADEIDPARVVLEMTEHTAISDYGSVQTQLAFLRALGFRIAVDDAGSGFASLTHILQLKPDIIKLDSELIRNIDGDPAKRALATAMINFAGEMGAELVAEGVETEAEFWTVRRLGIRTIQGYLLGRPQTLPLAEIEIPAPDVS